MASKNQMDNFGEILQLLGSTLQEQVLNGCHKLLKLLEVLYSFDCSHLHSIPVYQDHVERVFNNILNSSVLLRLDQLILFNEQSTVLTEIKITILKSL